jgi:hypothetical protein
VQPSAYHYSELCRQIFLESSDATGFADSSLPLYTIHHELTRMFAANALKVVIHPLLVSQKLPALRETVSVQARFEVRAAVSINIKPLVESNPAEGAG